MSTGQHPGVAGGHATDALHAGRRDVRQGRDGAGLRQRLGELCHGLSLVAPLLLIGYYVFPYNIYVCYTNDVSTSRMGSQSLVSWWVCLNLKWIWARK